MIVSEQVLAALASAAIPTIAVLVGILINNHRLSDVNLRINETLTQYRSAVY
jgi:hypothetical protein